MKAGDKVIITNQDSSFHGETGRIVAINGPFFAVFISGKDKSVYNFARYDLEILEEEGEE